MDSICHDAADQMRIQLDIHSSKFIVAQIIFYVTLTHTKNSPFLTKGTVCYPTRNFV